MFVLTILIVCMLIMVLYFGIVLISFTRAFVCMFCWLFMCMLCAFNSFFSVVVLRVFLFRFVFGFEFSVYVFKPVLLAFSLYIIISYFVSSCY